MSSNGEMYIDPHKLIKEVKKRSILFKHPAHKNVRAEHWVGVCENIIDNWASYSDEMQIIILQSIQQKWRNMRDSYIKELRIREKGGTKKRKYLFYDDLTFLKPLYRAKRDTDNANSTTLNEYAEDASRESNFVDTDAAQDSEESLDALKPQDDMLQQVKIELDSLPLPHQCDQEEIEVDKKKHDQVDEDEYFLMSLLPTFRRFTEDQKFEARIEIMRALNRIRKNSK